MSLYFTKEHEWIRVEGDVATVGISDHAQEALGDIVFAEVPGGGRTARQGRRGGGGRIGQGRQRRLCPGRRRGDRGQCRRSPTIPSLINRDPEGEGWFFKLKLADPSELEGLMDEAAYREWVKTL